MPTEISKREPLRTLEQKRAKKAWDQVNEIVEESRTRKKLGENYRSLVRKAPAMIKTNGLGQTLAFLLSKAKEGGASAEDRLYKHLEAWLLGEEAPLPRPSGGVKSSLMEQVMALDSALYRQYTREALTYLGWLKRFAEARLKKDGGG